MTATSMLQSLDSAAQVETVGLVTKAEFLSKRNTIKERLEEEAKAAKRAASDAVLRVRLLDL